MDVLINTARASQILGIRPQTLRRWRMRGCGPRYIRTGGRWGRAFYRMQDLVEWAQARSYVSTSNEVGTSQDTPQRSPAGGMERNDA